VLGFPAALSDAVRGLAWPCTRGALDVALRYATVSGAGTDDAVWTGADGR
jgi:hypothetical protein